MRLPFDPAKMAQPATPAKAETPRSGAAGSGGTLTVSQLAERLTDAIGAGFPAAVRVAGEVSGFKPGSHWYFSLKDAGAVVSCVMFTNLVRAALAGGGFTPSDGQQVVVTGKPDYWAKGGRTSFIVTRIEPVGQGALDAAFKALCDELRKLGWFEPARKRPVPRFPRRVAVVTSRTGAAITDVLDTMRRRCPAVEVALVDVSVQGEGAAAQVAHAIGWIGRNHQRLGVDAVLVTRGGGSREDLWTFNERVVAEAIVNCPLPVVAAIGHESDVTIAELVADERCATPTQAAMRLTPDAPALLEQLAATGSFLRSALIRVARDRRARLDAEVRHANTVGPAIIQSRARRLEAAAARLERHRPAAEYARRQAMLEAARDRLAAAMRARLAQADTALFAAQLQSVIAATVQRAAERTAVFDRQLNAVGPAAVLKRGFSVTTREDGSIVRSIVDARPGERVRTRVADGAFGSVVDGATTPPPAPDKPREPRGRKSKSPPGERTLFSG